jgi:hypothetical protein
MVKPFGENGIDVVAVLRHEELDILCWLLVVGHAWFLRVCINFLFYNFRESLIPFISTGYCCAHPYSFFCD